MVVTDNFSVIFVGAGCPVASGSIGMRSFIEALELNIGDLRPTTVEGVERFESKWPFSRENFWTALEQVVQTWEPRPNIFFERSSSPHVRISVNLKEHVAGLEAWNIGLTVEPFSHFEEPQQVSVRSQRVLDLVRAWASWYPAHYGVAHSRADLDLAQSAGAFYSAETYETVHDIYWLNILGPQMVRRLGRERVLSTPAYLVEPLPPGGVLLVTRPTVADILSEEARLAQARALVHLRPDLRLEEVMSKLRERSRVLAREERRFEPDVGDLLDRIVESRPLVERPRMVAEFNRYQSPEADEWRPCEAALSPDVESPAREMLRYRRELPNRLLEKINMTELSLVPEALVQLDLHFWTEADEYAFGQPHLVRWLVPLAGAFLGEVMVRSLEGCWVPRKNLSEAQVLVGDRVYLPFVRAQRYLQSRQSILDYSLTKLYRSAERIAGVRGIQKKRRASSRSRH
ncbi:hypothetical protein [Corallococcus sp. AB018]|uniref:hypothetical protein n=1 Tax=Corallococcus sp. AB018 TaxID=2316715 RepID=UPI000F8863B9|nr:hypothetical protein [Corallococcus sp. AB018]